uniref:Uncharacterized protein n=1 Tax=Arundo donax TaxID=35708 RepID=A0A0A9FKS5_ARUDO
MGTTSLPTAMVTRRRRWS